MNTRYRPSHARARTERLSRLAGLFAIVSLAAGILTNVATAGTPGAERWARRYDGAASSFDSGRDVEVTPDGSTVVVTGETFGSEFGDLDFVTVAYDAVTGARRWFKLYDGSGHADDQPSDLAITPDGSTAVVTGYSWGATSGNDFGTVAYDTATGAVQWKKRYIGEEGGGCCSDTSVALAVSPNGSKVFVTGHTTGPTSTEDYATVAYRASTGAQLWAKGYNGTGSAEDFATEIGVTPDDSTVFVSGQSVGSNGTNDYATVAYDAATGSRQWVKRYEGPGAGSDAALALGVAPGGSAVFVTGVSSGSTGTSDYATLAYDAATGSRRWVKRYNGPSDGDDAARDLGVSPDGSTVFVTGSSFGSARNDAATIAYDAVTGGRRWVTRIRTMTAEALAISEDGSNLTVTGYAQLDSGLSDYATVAYEPTTGGRLWRSAYDGPASLSDHGIAVATVPDGSAVFVTGTSEGSTTNADLATVAYGA